MLLTSLMLVLAGWAVARGFGLAGAPAPLRIATWNMQWLVDPDTALAARIACREGRRAALPCDVARAQSRDSADLRAIAAITRRLDADIIAFQEVENAAIARRVFPGYAICIAEGPGVQHAGFAVRAGLDARCEPAVESLSAGGRGRVAQHLHLRPADGPPIELLAVHLKSGCSRDAIDSPAAACVLLAAQARALGEWIAARTEDGSRFIVLGDLNRAGAPDAGDAFWQLLDPTAFIAAATYLPYRNCVFGAPYEAFIDHILVGQALVPRLHEPAFRQLQFDPGEAMQFRLPDHCPVSVTFSPYLAL